MTENTMTLERLVQKWRAEANEDDSVKAGYLASSDLYSWKCADELQAYIEAHLSRPVSVSDEDVTRVRDAVSHALSDVLDCTRVWEAWSYGTMSEDDFIKVCDQPDRVDEIARAILEADRAGRGMGVNNNMIVRRVNVGRGDERYIGLADGSMGGTYSNSGSLEERLLFACAEVMLAQGNGRMRDDELPGMWSASDFTGGDPDERSYAARRPDAEGG